MSEAVVIIGSGLAGYNVARELRKADANVPIVVVSRDHAGFYSKPMLSNALAGKKTAATLVMKPAEKMSEDIKGRVIANSAVTGIDTQARTVTLASGEVLTYRDLVLALGADPIRLPLKGDAADTVLSVNDLDDFARFAEALDTAAGGQPVKRVAILGAGLIGCEFANDLLHRGIEPTVLDLADRALARLLPAEASARLQDKLQAGGTTFRFGVGVQSVDKADGGLKLTLSDGSTMQTDLVLSAIGLKPRTHLATEAGVLTGRGVMVNRELATNVPHVYAVGDCAEVDGHLLPYVLPLMAQARALAATLAGKPTPVAYPAMPVVVKTPAWPTVVCPPPANAAGNWTVKADDESVEARFTAADNPEQLLGFALQGKAVTQRQAMAALVPAVLA
ncbi:pyridine nucleotide-disulfide oxidoreductase [Aquabacterium sp. NJ1]|uniref:NAD(P)/FAD-dependent oxidoreductase n=1 Tax=Aquabacterium sp. NJ1 TaxID=1538295 RepID=UPI00052CE2B1|nr:FAD-dependent oxidoreductase [Aquabacterium sp. NJ1]KGM41052.1 pyridine nucleotide-disulfide oxidoreductase [Aquabacterium sp. NJ1]